MFRTHKSEDSDKEKRNPKRKESTLADIKKMIKNVSDKFNIVKELSLSSDALLMLENTDKFEFDIFELHKETNGNEMITLATYLVHKHNLFVELAIEFKTFGTFISSIQEGYNDVAYHNKIHGMDVGRLAYYYGTTCGLVDK